MKKMILLLALAGLMLPSCRSHKEYVPVMEQRPTGEVKSFSYALPRLMNYEALDRGTVSKDATGKTLLMVNILPQASDYETVVVPDTVLTHVTRIINKYQIYSFTPTAVEGGYFSQNWSLSFTYTDGKSFSSSGNGMTTKPGGYDELRDYLRRVAQDALRAQQ